MLRSWLRELGPGNTLAFPNARGGPISRYGIAYILERAAKNAQQHCPSLREKHLTPHVIRHTTAMHLLQAGVDLSVIALWLGHEGLETTHGYIEADLATKERALAKLTPPATSIARFRPNDALLAFLARL